MVVNGQMAPRSEKEVYLERSQMGEMSGSDKMACWKRGGASLVNDWSWGSSALTDSTEELAAFLKPDQPRVWWDQATDALQQRLARLALSHLSSIVLNSDYIGGVQQQAYLGNNGALREHMTRKSMTTMTTARVRKWLEDNGGFPPKYTNAKLSLADFESVGGQDHPFNFVLLPKKLNSSLSGWWTAEKQAHIGRATARTAKNFFVWVREEGSEKKASGWGSTAMTFIRNGCQCKAQNAIDMRLHARFCAEQAKLEFCFVTNQEYASQCQLSVKGKCDIKLSSQIPTETSMCYLQASSQSLTLSVG
ncbi:TPA: hypothetical protein ACH3X3_014144 [Trebouxia sp. C0006]